MDKDLARGDIVQVIDETHSWFGCLLVVDEVKGWGVMAYVSIPHSNDGSEEVGLAYNRLSYDKIEKVGTAAFVIQE